MIAKRWQAAMANVSGAIGYRSLKHLSHWRHRWSNYPPANVS